MQERDLPRCYHGGWVQRPRESSLDGLTEGGRRASIFLNYGVQEVVCSVRLCTADSEGSETWG